MVEEGKSTQPRGFTLVEVILGILILSVAVLALTQAQLFFSRHKVHIDDRSFAAQKAIQMMEELRGVVSRPGANIFDLEDYEDGNALKPILTTRAEVSDPGDPLSGNRIANDGKNRFLRRINIEIIPNESSARRVHVRVYRSGVPAEVLAETMSILRAEATTVPPTQVYHVYCLAIENVPAWNAYVPTLKQTFGRVLQDLETRNPGLEFKTKFITRLSYGRDPYYRPFVNKAKFADDTTVPGGVIPSVYFYPGKLKQPGPNTPWMYYVPDDIKGRINVDGTAENGFFGDAGSYSLADYYNHAVRYPDELAIHGGLDVPTLRMFLEKINSTNPADLREFGNILIVNLHGEILPMPPIRNYSDPAKDPAGRPNVRVVTHPERLQYPANTMVILRVYPYVTNPGKIDPVSALPWTDPSIFLDTVTILLPDIQINPANIVVWKASRPVVPGPYVWRCGGLAAIGCGGPFFNTLQPGTDYQITSAAGQTRIELYRSSYVYTADGTTVGTGLQPAQRLYGLEYIPSIVDRNGVYNAANPNNDFSDGSWDLTDSNIGIPKNTASWRIVFRTPVGGIFPDGVYKIETRLGTNLLSGTPGGPVNEFSNLSRTYVWVGVDPPVTERYQFMGDPRHMPYADVKQDHRYNWHFSNQNFAGYNGFDRVQDGWLGGNIGHMAVTNPRKFPRVEFDAPRFLQLYRQGLLNVGGFFVNMAGPLSYYAGFGGEMGVDRYNGIGFEDGIPIIARPWQPANPGTLRVDEISTWAEDPGVDEIFTRVIAQVGGPPRPWVSLPWLGELYPDNQFAASWQEDSVNGIPRGNLPVGVGNFFRAPYSDNFANIGNDPIHPNAVNTYSVFKQIHLRGAAAFLGGNPTPILTPTDNFKILAPWPDLFDATMTNPLQGLAYQGTTMAQDMNLPLPSTMTVNRPFTLDADDNEALPAEWASPEYAVRTKTKIMEVYYEHDDNPTEYDTSGLIQVSFPPGAPLNAAYFIINGILPQTNVQTVSSAGAALMSRLAMGPLMRGFLSAGNPNIDPLLGPYLLRVPQVPLVQVSSPTAFDQFGPATSSIQVEWGVQWKRWDFQDYTEAYSAFTEADISAPALPLEFGVLYSDDRGASWKCANGGSATAGEKSCGPDASPFSWNVSNQSTFPTGTYILRVEAYRQDRDMHYAYHNVDVHIKL